MSEPTKFERPSDLGTARSERFLNWFLVVEWPTFLALCVAYALKPNWFGGL